MSTEVEKRLNQFYLDHAAPADPKVYEEPHEKLLKHLATVFPSALGFETGLEQATQRRGVNALRVHYVEKTNGGLTAWLELSSYGGHVISWAHSANFDGQRRHGKDPITRFDHINKMFEAVETETVNGVTRPVDLELAIVRAICAALETASKEYDDYRRGRQG